jgi:hypothetical protein
MIKIEYPEPSFRIKKVAARESIFDPLRQQWLVLTPEEWVRQNFIQYLVQVKQFPATLIAQEKELKLGDLRKRFDILVYDNEHRPWMMVECKEMNVPITPAVFSQILRYNISIPVPYLVITNGKECMGWQRSDESFNEIAEIPSWK